MSSAAPIPPDLSDARQRSLRREQDRQRAKEERKIARRNEIGGDESDEDDPLAKERRKWQAKQKAKAAAAGEDYSGDTIAMSQEDQLIMKGKKLQQENVSTLKNTIKIARETTQVGASTIHKLDQQTGNNKKQETMRN